jgi:hypothetical protein
MGKVAAKLKKQGYTFAETRELLLSPMPSSPHEVVNVYRATQEKACEKAIQEAYESPAKERALMESATEAEVGRRPYNESVRDRLK